MNFETVSLLMNYLEIGVLLAILFRLGRTFELIANAARAQTNNPLACGQTLNICLSASALIARPA
jgi:hypothetical protein